MIGEKGRSVDINASVDVNLSVDSILSVGAVGESFCPVNCKEVGD